MSVMNHRLYLIITIFFTLFFTCSTAFAQNNDKPRLGLSVSPMQASPLLLQHLRLAEGEGIMVSNVAVGSELEAAGLSQGDIVLAIDGNPLEKPSDLTKYIQTLPKGTQVTLDVIQKGEHGQIIAALDNLPDEVEWKYVQPITSLGRSGLNMYRMNPPSGQTFGPSQRSQNFGTQKSTFSSIISTPQGIQSSTITIDGDKSDPNSKIEIIIGDNTYRTTIGEIDQLPDEARTAAQSALSQSQNFSFSFGFGNGDIFDEIMRIQMEHMQKMDEMFQKQFQFPGTQAPIPPNTPPDPPVPVKPGKNNIRT